MGIVYGGPDRDKDWTHFIPDNPRARLALLLARADRYELLGHGHLAATFRRIADRCVDRIVLSRLNAPANDPPGMEITSLSRNIATTVHFGRWPMF